MYINQVSIIEKGVLKTPYSYFSKEEVEIGALVSVNLRNREVKGIILSSNSLNKSKIEIKGANYTIKKINKVILPKLFSQTFIKALNRISHFYATDMGSIINSISPKAIWQEIKILEKLAKENKEEKTEKISIEGASEERYSIYKSSIRECFAKKKSVFLCVPTVLDSIKAERELGKGIESVTFNFASVSSKKEKEMWINSLEIEKPVLVIGTGKDLIWNRKDLGLYILEKEMAQAHTTFSRPLISYGKCIEIIADEMNIKMITGDVLLKISNREQFRKMRNISSLNEQKGKVIDMSGKELISEEIKMSIINNLMTGNKILLLNARRGLAPITVCNDCGTLIRCPNCDSPVTLHTKKSERKYICHHCGKEMDTKMKCSTCGGWNLNMLGIGTETIEKEIDQLLKENQIEDVNIIRVDSDNTNTPAKAKSLIKKFNESKKSIAIGTEMILGYLDQKVDYTYIISFDALFSLPDLNIKEKVMRTLLLTKEITNKELFIQTRQKDTSLFQEIASGNINQFVEKELEDRKALNYPPYSILLKITAVDRKDRALAKIESIKKILKEINNVFDLNIFPIFIPKESGKYALSSIMKLDRKIWNEEKQDKALLDFLIHLPPDITFQIDTESVI